MRVIYSSSSCTWRVLTVYDGQDLLRRSHQSPRFSTKSGPGPNPSFRNLLPFPKAVVAFKFLDAKSLPPRLLGVEDALELSEEPEGDGSGSDAEVGEGLTSGDKTRNWWMGMLTAAAASARVVAVKASTAAG